MTVAPAPGLITGRKTTARRAALALLCVVGLGACSTVHNPIHIKHHRPKRSAMPLPPSDLATIGVNAYLWRASLDTLGFMPLLQVDSKGGVIVTDWYVNPQVPGERMKVSVTIFDKDLRSDALHVVASRQVAQGGGWVDVPVQAATVQKLEDVILTKARDLRRASIEQ